MTYIAISYFYPPPRTHSLPISSGGSWQAFMAWVPNGSAMQIAEPWKPLPQPTEEEKKGRNAEVVVYMTYTALMHHLGCFF